MRGQITSIGIKNSSPNCVRPCETSAPLTSETMNRLPTNAEVSFHLVSPPWHLPIWEESKLHFRRADTLFQCRTFVPHSQQTAYSQTLVSPCDCLFSHTFQLEAAYSHTHFTLRLTYSHTCFTLWLLILTEAAYSNTLISARQLSTFDHSRFPAL